MPRSLPDKDKLQQTGIGMSLKTSNVEAYHDSNIDDWTDFDEEILERACDQVILLRQQLKGLQRRFQLAVQQSNRPFACTLKMKISIVNNTLEMFEKFCEIKSKMIRERYEQLGLDKEDDLYTEA